MPKLTAVISETLAFPTCSFATKPCLLGDVVSTIPKRGFIVLVEKGTETVADTSTKRKWSLSGDRHFIPAALRRNRRSSRAIASITPSFAKVYFE